MKLVFLHLIGRLLNSTSDRYEFSGSELVGDDLISVEVSMIINLEFLVDLQLTLDVFLSVGVGELGCHLGAIIGHILDEEYLAVIHTILLELEVIDNPSWGVCWALLLHRCPFRCTVSTAVFGRVLNVTSTVSSVWNFQDGPFGFAGSEALDRCLCCVSGAHGSSTSLNFIFII